MIKLEELEKEIVKLKLVEENIINKMRLVRTMGEKVELLCELEVVRYDINPLYEKCKSLIIDDMINKKEKI